MLRFIIIILLLFFKNINPLDFKIKEIQFKKVKEFKYLGDKITLKMEDVSMKLGAKDISINRSEH